NSIILRAKSAERKRIFSSAMGNSQYALTSLPANSQCNQCWTILKLLHGWHLQDGDEESIDIVNDGSDLDEDTKQFDTIIGALEDILMDPAFEDARETFCRANCSHFEDNGENKLIYTDVFSRYTELLESLIASRLEAAIPAFDMQASRARAPSLLLSRHSCVAPSQTFFMMLDEKKDELMSDVFDLLLSLGDFEAFRELMLSYKRDAAGSSQGLQVQCCAMKIHTEEQEDGEERPDLDLGLTISPVGTRPNRF
ncbi:hypothetical protein QJQ45_016144, partial [Haematococcus lacustris]